MALVVQVRFCRKTIVPDATVSSNQTKLESPVTSMVTPGRLTGTWDMSVQKKHGGVQNWTLTLTQNGEVLSGVLTSEGGDLPVSGTIKGNQISLAAKKFGITVEFPAKVDGEMMTGTMKALMISREWTAKRR